MFGFACVAMSEGGSERGIDRLIAIEWDIIRGLVRELDGELSSADRVRIANSLAYHVNTLNKLLVRRDELPVLDEEPLLDVISRFPRRFKRALVGRVRRWRRSLS